MQMRFGHSGPPRVLVVDNESLIVASTVAILNVRGYDVCGAYSGEEAVAEAAGFEPDLVISDISMYRMNGIEAAAHIVAMFPECRVLFQSGGTTLPEIAPMVPDWLIYSFARKPMPVQDLLDCVATLLSAVETFETQLPPSDDVPVNVSALNHWRWAFDQSRPAGFPGTAASATGNIPDVRSVLVSPVPARDAGFTIQ